jgi:hypothetical protein
MYPVRIAPKAASPLTHDIDLWHACFIPEVRVELLWQLKFGQRPLRRRRNVTASGVNSSERSRGGLMQMPIVVSPRCKKNEVNANLCQPCLRTTLEPSPLSLFFEEGDDICAVLRVAHLEEHLSPRNQRARIGQPPIQGCFIPRQAGIFE